MHRIRTGVVCALLLAGCEQASEPQDEGDLSSGAQPLVLPPTLPPPPQGATCVLIQRGTLGQAEDADVSFGNGTWAAGGYPMTWTGPSPYDHWSLYRFDLGVVPQGAQIVLAAFTVYVSWNEQSSTVRAHRITGPWSEPTVTWQSFGGNASWDPGVIASFDPVGVGYKSIDVTALAQGFHAGLFPNQGLLLEEDPVQLHSYLASESSDIDKRPSLYVCYAAGGPCGGKLNGDACDDGNACTTGETCQNGQCVGGAPKSCDPLDACHEAGVCDPVTGVCTDPVKPDGAPCNDGDACTGPDTCAAGACTGAAVSCDDGSACTTDTCDSQTGCLHTAVSCDDGLGCTDDSCSGGGCQHTVQCPPGQPCSPSFCNTPEGQSGPNAWLCANGGQP